MQSVAQIVALDSFVVEEGWLAFGLQWPAWGALPVETARGLRSPAPVATLKRILFRGANRSRHNELRINLNGP